MSDLELAKAKLIDTIGHYNATASNIQKFKFNQLETNVFTTMMVEFAKELANEDIKQTENALAINGVSTRLLRELRKHYLVEIDFDSGLPKADMKTIMSLWDEVNRELQIITIDS